MGRVIAVDLDEVLAGFVPPLCTYHNEKYNTKLQPSDFFSYRFCEVWGGDDAGATSKVHDFFKTSHFQNLPVIPGAREGISQLQALGHELVVVTSRQLVIEKETRDWLGRMFPAGTFRQVAFGNHWGMAGRKVRKLDLCRELDATVLIDDSLSYTREVAAGGLKAVLFDLNGEYGWNKSEEDVAAEGITRALSWEQVVQVVGRMGD